jgi:hypothetical protein
MIDIAFQKTKELRKVLQWNTLNMKKLE